MSNIEKALQSAESALAILRAALEDADLIEIQNQADKNNRAAENQLFIRF